MERDISRRKLIGGIAAVGGMAVLAGATPFEAAAQTLNDATRQIRRGGTLTVGQLGFGVGESMNLSLLNSQVDILRQSLIREGLWMLRGKTFAVENGLAESQELSSDGKTLSVKLRRGVTWHDGKNFTADDVIWSIQQWKVASNVSIMASLLDFSRLRKTGPLSLDIGFTIPIADFPGMAAINLGTYIIQDGAAYEDGKYTGTGPFKFESFEPGKAVFTANKNYWGEGPYLDRVVSDSTFIDEQARINALRAGLIDVLPTVPYALAGSIARGGIQLLRSERSGFVTLSVRVDQAPFNDPRVMEAMKLLVDREAIIRSAYAGYATAGNDLGMKGAPYYASDLIRAYDPDKARFLLKAAGADSYQGTIITSAFATGATELATIYSQQASTAGLNLQVKTIDTSEFYNTEGPNAYLQRSLGMNDWGPSTLTGYYFLGLHSKAPFNDTHWGNATSDKLLFDAIAEQDPGKAADKWHSVQLEQFDRGGYIIPAHGDYVDAVGPTVRGLNTTPSGGNLDNYNFSTAWIAS